MTDIKLKNVKRNTAACSTLQIGLGASTSSYTLLIIGYYRIYLYVSIIWIGYNLPICVYICGLHLCIEDFHLMSSLLVITQST